VLAVLVGGLAFFYKPFDALDIYRYYEYGTQLKSFPNISSLISYHFVETLDFLYYTFQYICLVVGLPMSAVTGLSVGILYAQSYKLIDLAKRIYCVRIGRLDSFLVNMLVITTAPVITVFGIGRNTTAVMFAAIGFRKILLNQPGRASAYFALASLTHVAMIPYTLLFLFGYYCITVSSVNVYRVAVLSSIATSLFAPFFISALLALAAKFLILETGYDYSRYLDLDGVVRVIDFGLGSGDLAVFFSTAGIVLLLLLGQKKTIRPIVLGTTVVAYWFILALGFSILFSQRTMLLLIPLIGVTSVLFFEGNPSSYARLGFRAGCAISAVVFLWNVYSYRDHWEFGLPA
jgi:hypothetical protein